ncbi:MAG: hypothetical protein IPK52_26115 [Chloroflexi bacterium]|nr:hypothetical protein [Chloroflexota bacterium]
MGIYDEQGKLIYTDADGQPLTGKRLQAKLAAQQLIERGITTQDISLIGYSAGADAAMIFMDEYVDQLRQSGWTGKVSDIVIIGGTATGGMSGGRALEDNWSSLANSILHGGTDILVVDDNAENVSMPSSYPQPTRRGVGTLTYYPVDLIHSEDILPGINCLDNWGYLGQ